MTSAGALIGGLWAAYDSPVVEAYARAAAWLGANATRLGAAGRLYGWTLRADRAAAGAADNGRPVVGYPAPATGSPVWVAPDPGGVGLLAAGVDFVVADGYVWFETDPLAAATAAYFVWAAGAPVRAADVWYGTAPEAAAAPAPPAGSRAALAAAVATACASPATAGAETVEAVWEGPAGWRVATDAAGYRLPAADAPAAGVVAGAALPAGTPLGTAWALTRLGPAKPALTHLTTPAAFHQGATAGGVTWYDDVVPLVVDVVGGRTRVRFEIGATDGADAAAFWAESHARGTAAGARSLAQALDTRTAPPAGSDPGPESLPKVINPLEFVCRELFAGAAYLLVVRPARFGPAALPAAARAAAVRAAAGAYAAVFEYEDAVPALTPQTPS